MVQEFLNEREKKILDLGTRRKIFEIVAKHAGCHFRELERKSNLKAGSVNYHLNYLTKHGLIKEQKQGSNSRYFPRHLESQNMKMLGLLRQKSIRNILLFVLVANGCSHLQITSNVKLSPSTVSWHLKKLLDEKILSAEKKGRQTIYTVIADKQAIVNLLITYQNSFIDRIIDNIIEMWEM